MYLHLPMTIDIVAAGAAVFNVVEKAGEPLAPVICWLLLVVIMLMLAPVIYEIAAWVNIRGAKQI